MVRVVTFGFAWLSAAISVADAVVPTHDVPEWACSVVSHLGSSVVSDVAALKAVHAKFEAVHAPPVAGPVVEAVTEATLNGLLQAATEDLLIVFYAPWCGTCHGFLYGGAPAPINVLSQELSAANGPRVVKWDIQANGHPSAFHVRYVPDIYLATRVGGRTPTACGPHDVPCLKAFALGGMSPLAAAPPVASLFAASGATPAWACQDTPEVALGAGPSAHQVLHLHAQEGPSLVGKHSVPAYQNVSLTKAVKESKGDMLVVFYAPWCGHCQTFVVADADGNRTNAPLEVLNRYFVSTNGPEVVKFDVQQSARPQEFESKYIPSTWLVKAGRAPIAFAGDPHDLQGLAHFALQGREPQLTTSFMLAAPAASVDAMPAWACAVPELADGLASGSSVHLHAQAREKAAATGAQLVAAYDSPKLMRDVKAAKRDVLVVFYAPWCGHCQTFVLADGTGNATNAPLELLNQDLVRANGPKVVKFDVTLGPRPPLFESPYIPAVFLAPAGGAPVAYPGDPHDVAALKAWALRGASLVSTRTHLRRT